MTGPMSPCTSICVLGSNGLCIGCMRSSQEIAEWYYMSDKDKHEVLKLLENRWRADETRL